MGTSTGFKDTPRVVVPFRDAAIRVSDYDEIHTEGLVDQLRNQGGRCMDCGVPFCQSERVVPSTISFRERNDLVYRGRWRDALERLHQTNNFPEFTGRTCPAPCEGACVLGIIEPAVTIKNIKNAIVDRGFAEGWIKAAPPLVRSRYKVPLLDLGQQVSRQRPAQSRRTSGHSL
ncbi:MAG: hypothetical protein Ct9H300mP13_2360 [Gammaproteobacteria bacterium]|nr:MAG: hypothetical protein Ct9H300mP13_2360 [Gammaproteobacteria bacterium]